MVAFLHFALPICYSTSLGYSFSVDVATAKEQKKTIRKTKSQVCLQKLGQALAWLVGKEIYDL